MIKGAKKMKIIKRLKRLQKQIPSNERGPERVAIKYNGGEITWNNKIYYDDESFHNAVESYYKTAPPPAQGPRVIVIRFWRDINDIKSFKPGKQPCS
jgi:hypothetical protein